MASCVQKQRSGPLPLQSSLGSSLGPLAAAVVQRKAALSLSVGRHSSSRCDSQDLPGRATSRGRATEASSLSVGCHSIVVAATLKICLGELPAAVVQQKAALSLLVVTLVLAVTHKTCLGGLPAAVVQQKAALSLCRSPLWFSLRLSRLASED